VRELAVDSAAGDADEGPEAGAHVLRPEAVAVDASAVGRQLEESPHDPLVPLLLFPGRGRHRLLRAASRPRRLGLIGEAAEERQRPRVEWTPESEPLP
jgi:hypothetical protein